MPVVYGLVCDLDRAVTVICIITKLIFQLHTCLFETELPRSGYRRVMLGVILVIASTN